MKKPLLISLAAAALLTGNLNAASMFDRMTEMETEMKSLQTELAEVKAAKTAEAEEADADEDEEADDTDDEDADESDEDDDEDDEDDEDDIEESLEYVDSKISELNKATNGNHLKFGVDFRTSVDNLQYKMADGSKQKNNALFTNRLWLNMNWAATDNLSFTGQLAYNKAYGARSGYSGQIAGMETFDWITNENPYDDVVRVRSAYFFYRDSDAMIPWTFSIGRRPSTNGHLINLRDDDTAASPMGHNINVEFDGASAKFTVYEDWGTYFKFCAGRGGSNANPKFFSVDPTRNNQVSVTAPYSTDTQDLPNIDLGGIIFVPYNDGQYSIGTQYYYANNLIDAKAMNPILKDGTVPGPTNPPSLTNPVVGQGFNGMESVGGMHALTANFMINGIGDDWGDYLEDTTFFASAAMSITDPDKDSSQGMLGDSSYNKQGQIVYNKENWHIKKGYSYWIGLQVPSLITDDGKWGVEYNHGSKYWRSITYAEDTLAGSKIATRGSAYEVYLTEPIVGKYLTFQVRYTYLDYDYSGSNGFFGTTTGSATKIGDLTPQTGSTVTVDTAQDIRAYIRYRY